MYLVFYISGGCCVLSIINLQGCVLSIAYQFLEGVGVLVAQKVSTGS